MISFFSSLLLHAVEACIFLLLFQVPARFRWVVEQTLKEFFKAIMAGKDLDPNRESLKIYDRIRAREGPMPNGGKAPICLFHHVRNDCKRDPCDWCHDKGFTISESDKKACLAEMEIAFPKRKPGTKGKGKRGRSASPFVPTKDKDGKEHCMLFRAGKCERGDSCRFSHKD